jgi:N,N'-diacetyllegionaminate synthase
MLEKIARTQKPIILSSGMSDWNELEQAIDFLKPFGNELSIMQCTTAYPTLPAQWGLNMIKGMKEKFNIPVGFSDHSSTIVSALAATALGASMLEFHAVFDKEMFGPDAKASLTISEIKELVIGVKQITTSLAHNEHKKDVSAFAELKIMFGKSIAINKNLSKGTILKLEDLESKKPGNKGISAKDYSMVVGKKLNKDVTQWSFIQIEDIE